MSLSERLRKVLSSGRHTFKKGDIARVLKNLDLGTSIAETDQLLESARVETGVFPDLLNDKVDLVPGTKGSGKSALYRIFVDFLPAYLLERRRVVVAHGVNAPGDKVFLAFKDQFEELSETDFENFWSIYLVSLAHEHFIKNQAYASFLKDAGDEIERFKRDCNEARIPEIKSRLSLRDVLAWSLHVVKRFNPKLSYSALTHEYGLELFPGLSEQPARETAKALPIYVNQIRDDLDAILTKADLSLWLMVDRLDEIFPRRTELETKALRALLKTLPTFQSSRIRVKVFLRDDILEQISEGFTGLTHVTARQADSLRWSEDQILHVVVKRLFASKELSFLLKVDPSKLDGSREYRHAAFYKVFPEKVHPGANQSDTHKWIYTHTRDGRGVVTPRDVIDLLSRARQKQADEFQTDTTGTTDYVIGSSALQHGLDELSKRKRDTYLKAEFPHFWPFIEKFSKGKTEYDLGAISALLGAKSEEVLKNLVSIGFLQESGKGKSRTFKIPFVYRDGLDLTQGRAEQQGS